MLNQRKNTGCLKDPQEWKKLIQENEKLKEEVEVLRFAIRIERAKIRSLKKMLKAEYRLSKIYNSNLLLGLDMDADQTLIKKEYKKLLKALHPDRGGDERLYKVFNEHYKKFKG
ncbi:DnaJ domain-containing protein [Siminovitchia sediminis]|uniref:DnaJ domain-containing protein n=1 Tax=Siminovitchia sediminis TaxID=1274353 RepID=A0ABW4KDK2_9BACI